MGNQKQQSMGKPTELDCRASMLPIQDALEALNGKWKLLIISSISLGNTRFKEIERSIPKISSKVLAKELKDLENNLLIKRTVSDYSAVLTEYSLRPHAETLKDVLIALRDWGKLHRKAIIDK